MAERGIPIIRRTATTLAVALLSIGVLTILGQQALQSLIGARETAAVELNVAGRQRMLVQRVAVEALELTSVDGQAQTSHRNHLRELSAVLTQVNNGLQAGDDELGLSGDISSSVREVFDLPPYQVNAQLTELLRLSRALIATPEAGHDHPSARELAVLTDPSLPESLVNGLEEVVTRLEAEDQNAQRVMSIAGTAFAALIIITLSVIWRFGFRPLTRELRTSMLSLRESQGQLDHIAHHDSLTELPNRRGLHRELERRGETELALCVIDLDNFKELNDTLGHPVGDALLQAIADRLRRWVSDDGFAARLGGDEFAVLLDWADDSILIARCDELIRELSQTVDLGPASSAVTASAGIQVGRAHEITTLLRDADTALYVAKDSGKARVVRFEQTMRDSTVHHFELTTDLGKAVERNEFINYYQPIVDLESERPIALEALVRWQHPELGLLAPGQFLPIVRRHEGLLRAMTDTVITTALRDIARLRQHDPDLTVAINMPGSLLDQAMVDRIEEMLSDVELPGSALTVEITEHELVEHGIDQVLSRLDSAGMRVAVDDFGTGYCSLARLHTMPVDYLKLDRQFVSSVGGRGATIARAVIGMADELDLLVIAEGIETSQQLDAVRELGCKQAQGYYWSRPVAIDAAANMIASQINC